MVPESMRAGLRIVALRALGDEDEAEEVVQECMARGVAAMQERRVPPDVPLPAYAYGIIHHLIADQVRDRVKARFHQDPDLLTSPDPSPLEQTIRSEELTRARKALALLSAGDREILERCYLLGERLVEIAQALGEPQERIRKRKSRALARLRSLMEIPVPGHVSSPQPTSGSDDEEKLALRRR